MDDSHSPAADDRARIGRRPALYAVGIGVGSMLVPTRAFAQDGEEGDETADEEAAEDEAENGDEEADAEGNGGVETVDVADNYFEPETLSIEPGTTVEWIWVGEAEHNVQPEEQPDGADWEGHPDLQTDGEYEHTFDVEGTYEYVCVPHVAVGMVGSIEVGAGADAGGEVAEVVPGIAVTLVVATAVSLVAVLSLSYVFLKYGGPAR